MLCVVLLPCFIRPLVRGEGAQGHWYQHPNDSACEENDCKESSAEFGSGRAKFKMQHALSESIGIDGIASRNLGQAMCFVFSANTTMSSLETFGNLQVLHAILQGRSWHMSCMEHWMITIIAITSIVVDIAIMITTIAPLIVMIVIPIIALSFKYC